MGRSKKLTEWNHTLIGCNKSECEVYCLLDVQLLQLGTTGTEVTQHWGAWYPKDLITAELLFMKLSLYFLCFIFPQGAVCLALDSISLFIIWVLSVGCRHSTLRSLIRECKWYWLFEPSFQGAEKASVFLALILSQYDYCNQTVRLISGCDIYHDSCLYRSPLGECKQCFLLSSQSHFEITFPTALASHCVKATLSLRTITAIKICFPRPCESYSCVAALQVSVLPA